MGLRWWQVSKRTRRLHLVIWLLCCVFFPSVSSGKSEHPVEVVRFGVISLNHPLVMYRQYLPFTDYLTEQIGFEVELVLARDYENIVRYLSEGAIDFALLAGVTYLEGKTVREINLLCGVKAENGQAATRSVFIAREDRGDIDSLVSLKGKQFAFGSEHSTSSYLIPLWHLYRNGIVPSDFTSWRNLATQDAVVRGILRGRYDAGATSYETFKRFEERGLKMLAETVPFPGFVIVADATVPEQIQQSVRELLLNLDYSLPVTAASSAKWSPLLQHGFTPVKDSDYDLIRTIQTEMKDTGLYR